MDCLVVTPHRLGIPEMAERIGQEWEEIGHTVEYTFARGEAARLGPVTIGMPGIAVWWYRTLKTIASAHEKYDLIWTHQPVAPVLPTSEEAFWDKVVATMHTTLGREYELVREGVYPRRLLPYYWFAKTLEARFHRTLACLDATGPHYTVVSPHIRNELSGFGADRATYIPNGVFTPVRTFEPIRPHYDIPDDATVVFNVGSLTAQKRPKTFANCMRAVTDERDSTYVVMAGDGPYRDAVKSYESDHFQLVGYVSDDEKWRWFADADIFASLSAYEGMPVATTEALSFDLPVILSEIPAHEHLFETYKPTGRLVSDSINEIIAAISEVQDEKSSVTLPTWQEAATHYPQLIEGAQDSSSHSR